MSYQDVAELPDEIYDAFVRHMQREARELEKVARR